MMAPHKKPCVVGDLQQRETHQGGLCQFKATTSVAFQVLLQLFIALIGCHMGMTVRRDTRSLGIATTSTVVQSIVAVILLDAAFAVLFQELDI